MFDCVKVSLPGDEIEKEADGGRRLLLLVQAVECLCQERNGRRIDEEHKSSVESSLHQAAEISLESPRLISEVKHRRQQETNQHR